MTTGAAVGGADAETGTTDSGAVAADVDGQADVDCG
jgi:hypothetical protein